MSLFVLILAFRSSSKKTPFTAAERARMYRERIKMDPKKYEIWRQKHVKYSRDSYHRKMENMSDAERERLRYQWRVKKERTRNQNALKFKVSL